VDEPINDRIERLLATPQPLPRTAPVRIGMLSGSIAALVGLLVLEAANVAIMLALMGCGPALLLGKLF